MNNTKCRSAYGYALTIHIDSVLLIHTMNEYKYLQCTIMHIKFARCLFFQTFPVPVEEYLGPPFIAINGLRRLLVIDGNYDFYKIPLRLVFIDLHFP